MIGAAMSRFRRRLGQIDAVHVGHLVVDHEAVDAGRAHGVQQRRAAPERPNVEAVGFKQESQRSEDVGVVVDHVDRWFGG